MSQITALTLADGQDTPVNQTFDVGSAQMGVSSPATWYEKSDGTFSSFKKVTMLVRRSTAGKSTRVTVRVEDPTLDAEGVLTHKTLATLEFVLPDTSTLQNRKDVLAYAKNLLGDAVMESAVHDMSPAY